MKLLAPFLKREHNVAPRVFDEAMYVVSSADSYSYLSYFAKFSSRYTIFPYFPDTAQILLFVHLCRATLLPESPTSPVSLKQKKTVTRDHISTRLPLRPQEMDTSHRLL